MPELIGIRRFDGRVCLLGLAVGLALGSTGCNRASATARPAVASAQEIESARQELELIPPPSKSRYLAVDSLTSWENPYLTVQENMVTLHVMLADANLSGFGDGGLLRPVGARRQDLILATEKLPDGLSAVPASSWPYGRVVAIEEAHQTPSSERPAVRRTMESTIKTLSDMGLVVFEWGDNAGEVR